MFHVRRSASYQNPGKTDIYSTPDLQSLISYLLKTNSSSASTISNRLSLKSPISLQQYGAGSGALSGLNLFGKKSIGQNGIFGVSNCSITVNDDLVALGVKNGIMLVTLPSVPENKSPIAMHHIANDSKLETSRIQFNPLNGTLIASAVGETLQIWDISRIRRITGDRTNAYQRMQNHTFESTSGENHLHSFPQAHDKTISDLGWSPDNEFIIASCSPDTFLRLRDLRASNSEPKSYSSFVPISMLRWHHSGQMIATAHEGDVKIWDIRMIHANSPMQFITAHTERVTNLDWSPVFPNEILTSSQDRLIRLWNITTPEDPVLSTTLQNSIVMASYTPFGDGIATIGKTPDLAIRLWKPDRILGKLNRVYEFFGHSEEIKSFAFRKAPKTFRADEDDYQIISWSKDWKLKMWSCDSEIRKSLEQDEILSSTSTSLHQETDDRSQSSVSTAAFSTFQEESNTIHTLLPQHVRLQNVDLGNKEYQFEITHPDDFSYSFVLEITYPEDVPFYYEPVFKFGEIKIHDHAVKLKKRLLKMKEQQMKYEGFRTLMYIQAVVNYFGKLPIVNISSKKETLDDISITASPRTCQAIFSPTGDLVFFCNFSKNTDATVRKRMSSKGKVIKTYEQFTRELKQSQIKSEDKVKKKQTSYIFEHVFHSEVDSNVDRSHHLQGTKLQTATSSQPLGLTVSQSQTSTDSNVHIYNTKNLLPISYQLAKELKIEGDARESCFFNRDVCLRAGMKKTATMWTIIAQIADSHICSNIESAEVWSNHPCGRNLVKSIIHQLFQQKDIQTIALISCILSTACVSRDADQGNESNKNTLLDPNDEIFYNTIRMYYSDILHRWKLDCQRNEILKFVHTEHSIDQAKESLSFVDFDCVKCSICHIPTEGLCMVCVNCGHGGHFDHMVSWFLKSSSCPTGCNCSCLQYMTSAFAPGTQHMAPEPAPSSHTRKRRESTFINTNVSQLTPVYNTNYSNNSASSSGATNASPGWQKFFARLSGAQPNASS